MKNALFLITFSSLAALGSVVFLFSHNVFAADTVPSVTLSASPSEIKKGAVTIITLQSIDADTCVISGPKWNETRYSNSTKYGSRTIHLTETATYRATCFNSVGQASAEATVTVTDTSPEENTSSLNSTTSSNNSNNTSASTNTTSKFNAACVANPSITQIGKAVTLTGSFAGGTGPYTFQWSGDASGESQIIYTSFSKAGTKTIEFRVADREGLLARAKCSLLIEEQKKSSLVALNTAQKPPAETQSQNNSNDANAIQQTETSINQASLATAAKTETSNSGLIVLLIISMLVNIALLVYFFMKANTIKKQATPRHAFNRTGGEQESAAF